MSTRPYSPATSHEFEVLAARAAGQVEADEEMLYELIQARKACGLTQRELAEILGVKQPTIAKFEHHDTDPKLSTIRRYALAVGAHVRHEVLPAEQAVDPLDAWSTAGATARFNVPMNSRISESAPSGTVPIDVEYRPLRKHYGRAA